MTKGFEKNIASPKENVFAKCLNELRYSLYLSVHPFKGFYAIKHEKKGGVLSASIILLLYIITDIINGYYGGYLFNPDGGIKFNPYKSIAVILVLFILWCVANWCFTSLFDGEGSFKDICVATAYALVPLVIVQIIKLPLSNVMLLEEGSFYYMIEYLGLIWSAFLLLLGNVVTHQYSLSKTILITVCTVAGMCVIAFIVLLFFNLFQQMAGFVFTLWQEAELRYS